MNEKDMIKANEGRMAFLTLREVGPLLETQEKDAVDQICGLFQKGELDLSSANRLVGTIVAVRNVKNNLTSKIKLAENLSKKEDKADATRNY